MTAWSSNRDHLTRSQYATDANLGARQAIYRFQQPRVSAIGWALDLAQLSGDERVFDMGCGNGLYLGELERRGHQGPCVGMDLSPGMLPAARGRSPRATLLVGDAEALPVHAGAVDAVLAMHMLYHVPDRARAIAEMRRVLRPCGVALAVTNARDHVEALNELVADVLQDLFGGERRNVRAYLRFSAESGAAELEASFASVTRHELTSTLEITDADAVVAYVGSMTETARVNDGGGGAVLDQVRTRVRAIIQRDGAFRVGTHVACFVCC